MDEVIRIAGQVENCYLVKGEHCYLVDTMNPKARKRLQRGLARNEVKPGDLTHILITHYHADHAGSLAYLKNLSEAKVVAGEEDIPYIQGDKQPVIGSDLNRLGRFMRRHPGVTSSFNRFRAAEVDVSLAGGEALEELGLEVIALPGHTPGGIGFLDRANNRAFVGDLVSNYFGHVGPPTFCASYSLQEIEASMKKLVELELDYMYPGHGRVIGPNASALLSGYVEKKFG
jgi:glyoxylase-like metal-dependent hydrolase (beta-lactamase superfamily II)